MYLSTLLFYCLLAFLITLSDGIMSYVAPIFIENHVSNSFIMGIIISSSSIVGIICDTMFPNVFRSKHHSFFLWSTVIVALLFPASFLFFPQAVPTYIFAMAIWGIYFELYLFSNAYFIDAFVKTNKHGAAWGILGVFQSVGLFIAPLFAPYLVDKGEQEPLKMTIMLLSLCLMGIFVFHRLFPHKKRDVVQPVVTKKYSYKKEFKVWRILFRRIWHIYGFILMFYLVEAAFLTIGVLLAEDLRTQSFWGGFLLAAFVLPGLFTGFFIERFCLHIGKKRFSFFCGAIGGGLLLLASLMTSPFVLIFTVFLSSIFMSAAHPAIMATIQDYVTRLDDYGSDMVGLKNATGSLAYIIGPIVAGWAGLKFGNLHAIGGFGALFGLIAILNVIIVPRKVHMPQHELQLVEEVEIEAPPEPIEMSED